MFTYTTVQYLPYYIDRAINQVTLNDNSQEDLISLIIIQLLTMYKYEIRFTSTVL